MRIGKTEELWQTFQDNASQLQQWSIHQIVDHLREDLHFLEAEETHRAPSIAHRVPAPLKDIPYDDTRGIYHPENVEHVQRLVQYAASNGVVIRNAGAEHSRQEAIFTQAATDMRVILDGDLRQFTQFVVEPGPGTALITVGAGCYLGVNPMDKASTLENSLDYQLDEKGYALPVLGGMSHQSLAGFLLTGSAGGSYAHGFADAVEQIDLVNGQGEVVALQKGTDEFNAAGVSMGLFGIVTGVTLRVGQRYFVEGTEENKQFEDSFLAPDAGGQGTKTYSKLKNALRENEYIHMNWFPQKYVRRVMQWTGKRVSPDQQLVPYKHELQDPFMNVLAAAVLFAANGTLSMYPGSDLNYRLVGWLLGNFVPLGKPPQRFCDLWYRALPVDDQAQIDTLIKTDFTELWSPVEGIDQALAILEEMYEDQTIAGNFACELYVAKQSPFWLSPAYGHDVFRIDPYWWAHNPHGTPEEYFTHFWNRLLDIDGTRLHWGKYVPKPGQKCGNTIFNLEYLQRLYPKLGEWLRIRDRMDPKQIFLSDYWRRIFEIAKP